MLLVVYNGLALWLAQEPHAGSADAQVASMPYLQDFDSLGLKTKKHW